MFSLFHEEYLLASSNPDSLPVHCTVSEQWLQLGRFSVVQRGRGGGLWCSWLNLGVKLFSQRV